MHLLLFVFVFVFCARYGLLSRRKARVINETSWLHNPAVMPLPRRVAFILGDGGRQQGGRFDCGWRFERDRELRCVVDPARPRRWRFAAREGAG